MNATATSITQSDLNQYLAHLILMDLVTVVDSRQSGHCLQVTDLPAELMEIVCQHLRAERTECEAYVLSPVPEQVWQITSTKLVERRNAGESVIVVFLPPDLHTSAEDSFDVSTFERLPIGNLYHRLRRQLLKNCSSEIRPIIDEVIRESGCKDDQAICQYLLALQKAPDKSQAMGLALFHLGLVPDPQLQNSLDVLRPHLIRNKNAVETLSTTDIPLFSRIQSLNLKEGRTPKLLYRFFDHVKTIDPSQWLPAILQEEFVHDLTFDKWDFREPVTGNIEDISFLDLGTSDTNNDGYPMFNVQRDKHLKIAWETTPPPLQCHDLSYFSVEVMKEGTPVTEARTTKIGKSRRKRRSTTLKNLHNQDLEEGLYYLRVSAWSSGGVPLAHTDSESIFFKGGEPEDDDTEEPTKRPRQFTIASRYEAMLRTQVNLRQKDKSFQDFMTTLAKNKHHVEMNWLTPERRTGGRYTDQFTIKYNAANQYTLPVNTILRRIEQETLADAASLGRWELDLRQPVTADIQPTLQPFEGLDYEMLDEFLLVRQDLFQKILNQPEYPNIKFLVETSDLAQWEHEIMLYVQAYLNILTAFMTKLKANLEPAERKNLLYANRHITNIDNVRLHLPDGKQAYLTVPTHPLKMLWSLQYARATRQWLHELENLPVYHINWNAFATFLPKLSSFNIPHALVSESSQLLVNVDSFSPFWTIFVPYETSDSRALVGRIKTLLGSPEADEHFTTITGTVLSRIVERYLSQHPYVRTLRINAVQPGSGAILEELLLALEKTYPYLRYHLHLFSGDFRRDELGGALDELMSPSEKRSGSEELDAFLTASQNVLFPKLTYSKHQLADLLYSPDAFEAHITLLFDAFNVEVHTAQAFPHTRSNHLYGLIQEYVEQFSSAEGNIRWQRQIVPQHGLDVEETKPVHEMMVNLFQAYNHLISAITTKGEYLEHVPTIHLPLGHTDKNLVNRVHDVSDWVFTIDRNFGLDYLDNPYDEYCPAYLIDYQPEYLGEVGHRLIISTQQISEIERIVQPVLERLNLPSQSSEARTLLNALRSISGRLVLKLISSPQMAHGALGMALARLFLERAELLQDMVLIPLDTHADLFMTARQETEKREQELSLRRTDMLLVEFEPERAMITFHLIEVKFRQEGNDLTTALELKERINEQLTNSMEVLRHFYDPAYTVPDRFDRLIRTRELATLLTFYLERAIRYQLVQPSQAEAMYRLFDQLERGYTLRFTRSGVIFNLSDQGYQTEREGDILYHYLGLDQAQELIASAVTAEDAGQTLSPDPTYADTRSHFTQRPAWKRLLPPPTQKLEEQKPELEPQGISSPDIVPEEPEDILPSQEIQLDCNILLGSKHPTPQYGILGQTAGQTVGLDLNGTNTISLFGVQGSGKSYTLGTILEMALMPIPGINQLLRPLASVVFHYSKTEDYKPEFISMGNANEDVDSDKLQEFYQASPSGLQDILVLTPSGKVEKRREEMPDLTVGPIAFDTSELDIEDWKFLMGVIGSEAMYVKKMNQILRKNRNNLSLNAMYQGVASAKLNDAQLDLARTRLEFVGEYIHDGQFLGNHVRPGRLIVVDLRDELIEQDEALGLFMVMLKIFSNARYQGQTFNKMIVFDEAHKYMSTNFIDSVTGVVREMRHKGTSVLIASQDPKSVPTKIIELSSQVILHQFSSPDWLKHVQKAVTSLQELTAGRLNMLSKGQAYIWSREASENTFETRAVKVDIRPRVTKHGGGTITAVE